MGYNSMLLVLLIKKHMKRIHSSEFWNVISYDIKKSSNPIIVIICLCLPAPEWQCGNDGRMSARSLICHFDEMSNAESPPPSHPTPTPSPPPLHPTPPPPPGEQWYDVSNSLYWTPIGAQALVAWSLRNSFSTSDISLVAEEASNDLRWVEMISPVAEEASNDLRCLEMHISKYLQVDFQDCSED